MKKKQPRQAWHVALQFLSKEEAQVWSDAYCPPYGFPMDSNVTVRRLPIVIPRNKAK